MKGVGSLGCKTWFRKSRIRILSVRKYLLPVFGAEISCVGTPSREGRREEKTPTAAQSCVWSWVFKTMCGWLIVCYYFFSFFLFFFWSWYPLIGSFREKPKGQPLCFLPFAVRRFGVHFQAPNQHACSIWGKALPWLREKPGARFRRPLFRFWRRFAE